MQCHRQLLIFWFRYQKNAHVFLFIFVLFTAEICLVWKILMKQSITNHSGRSDHATKSSPPPHVEDGSTPQSLRKHKFVLTPVPASYRLSLYSRAPGWQPAYPVQTHHRRMPWRIASWRWGHLANRLHRNHVRPRLEWYPSSVCRHNWLLKSVKLRLNYHFLKTLFMFYVVILLWFGENGEIW